LVRRLGAAEVVDYADDVAAAVHAAAPQGVTKVVHLAGDPAVLAGLLTEGGRLASLLGATAEQAGRDDVVVTAVMATYTSDKLADLLGQVAAGHLSVPVSSTHTLTDATDALADFGGGKLGKVVVTVP
jgi:hypothetical protein